MRGLARKCNSGEYGWSRAPFRPVQAPADPARENYVYRSEIPPPSVQHRRGGCAEERVNDNRKHLVFVVEDDDEVRVSTRALLEASGYAVREFASGEDVIAAGEAGSAGCIVLDQNLPGMSGLDLIRQLRADGVRTPAIMVSGNGKQLVAAATGAGVTAVLRKPISAEALEQWLAHILSTPG